MPREATGSVFTSKSGALCARVTIGPDNRPGYTLPWAKSKSQALARAKLMAALANQLRKANREESKIDQVMRSAAEATTREELSELRVAVATLAKTPGPPRAKHKGGPTFIEFAEEWASGRLQERFPDHVTKPKKGADALGMLRKHVPVEVQVMPMHRFELEHAELIMRSMPTLAQSSRNLLGRYVHRLLTLAVYPVKLLPANPIPKGWLPKPGPRKALAYLYPSEDAALMACTKVPLARRLFYGFLAREGMRSVSEGLVLTWRDLDLERGVIKLDENKTAAPRAWALDAGTARALAAWHKLQGSPTHGTVFPQEAAKGVRYAEFPAAMFRAALLEAGVNRPELHEENAGRRPIRLHDLRATFATLALGDGRSETWVRDRTGHRSTEQLNVYRRAARTASELELGWFHPLDEAIPEFMSEGSKKARGRAESSNESSIGRGKVRHESRSAARKPSSSRDGQSSRRHSSS